MKTELRHHSFEVRAAVKDDAFELHGTAVTYNALSQDLGGFKERFLPGAFTRSLASGSDVKCLFNHSQNHVLGRTANGTLQLFDTPEGLNFQCKLDPNQQAHRDLHASVKRGDINECSFAFRPDADGDVFEDVNERGARYVRRTVRSAQLFDCSVVTTPAYGNGATVVVARSGRRNVKSLEQQYLEKHGREYVSDDQLRQRLHLAGLQIKRDAAIIESDAQLRARVAAVGRILRAQETIEEIRQDLWED